MLRLNESAPGCGLLGSHDDFSVTQFLPPDTAVITQLRCGPAITSVSTPVCLKAAEPLGELYGCSSCGCLTGQESHHPVLPADKANTA